MNSLRRVLLGAALGTIAVALTLSGASPAVASAKVKPRTPPCSTFTYSSTVSGHESHAFIWCGGVGGLLVADAYVKASGSTYIIDVADDYCDNTGPFWHAHESNGGIYNLNANGCSGVDGKYEIGKTNFGSPKNWWVEFDGKNTPAYNFPS